MKELTIFIICIVLYIIVPFLGAWFERNKWRKFRKTFINSSLSPILNYKDISDHDESTTGYFRFFGYLEAMEDNDIIWLKSDKLSISAQVKNADIYLLPFLSDKLGIDNIETNNFLGPDDRPVKASWKRINSLSEKTRIFVFGRLYCEKNRKYFKSSKDAPLFVVIHDCSDECILRRSIWSGRPVNEYWNILTPVSLSIGSFCLFIYSYVLLRFPEYKSLAAVSLNLSLVPFLPFLPPGLVFYFVYNRFWKKAKLLRAEKDLLKLPLKYRNCGDSVFMLPDGTFYTKKVFSYFHEALKNVELEKCRIRLSSAQKKNKEKEYSVFGEIKDGHFYNPQDPMAELVALNGDPEYLSGLNKKTAFKYEIFSIIVFISGLLVNFIISFKIIRDLII